MKGLRLKEIKENQTDKKEDSLPRSITMKFKNVDDKNKICRVLRKREQISKKIKNHADIRLSKQR